jgi:hypothetical protein
MFVFLLLLLPLQTSAVHAARSQSSFPLKTLTVYSTAAEDGWVLESAPDSGVGGKVSASAATFLVGDDATDRQYRGLLSFNTSALPDNAVVVSAELKVKQQSITSADLFTTHGPLLFDLRSPNFGASASLQMDDFHAPALYSGGTLSSTPVDGWHIASLAGGALSQVNLTGRTQARLAFTLEDDNDTLADTVAFHSGNARSASNRPALTVQYYIPPTVTSFIHVDQFGYPPNAQKIAVISDPQAGYNAKLSFTPGALYEVRHTATDAVALSGAPTRWSSGATHSQSGDKVWYFDFSALTAPGEYYVYDSARNMKSYPFTIAADVYEDVLKQAVRTFYYQRFNFAKQLPYAEANWVDGEAFAGPEQGADTRAIHPADPYTSDPATAKDLRGGWFDAGDFNKYVNYADGTIHDLLFAYQQNPSIWGDDYNIPESGNGRPDLLDELKYELDWLLRMQVVPADVALPNFDAGDVGSVLHKVSIIDWETNSTPPSTDASPHRYAPPTASATISAAGAYAHAALVYQSLADPAMQAYGATLESAARAAWTWLQANPGYSAYDNAGFMNAAAEDTAAEQAASTLAAAVYLYALTGEAQFGDYIETHIADSAFVSADPDDYNRAYFDTDGYRVEGVNALLFYASLPASDPALAANIRDKYLSAQTDPYVDFAPLLAYQTQKDAYRAFIDSYHWGNNRAKGHSGNLMVNMLYYHQDSVHHADYENAAAGYIHYLHGVNPNNIVYLSNMGAHGAENSVPEFYHMWFSDGSAWDNVTTSPFGPAPGFLVGGPNQWYSLRQTVRVDGRQTFARQPPQKAYRSWNTPSERSWEVTENSITYQAAYIRLLAHFIVP